MSEILPAGLSFAIINKPLKKKEISKLINEAFRRCGIRETVIFADKLMYTGFTFATRAGLSICVDDLLIPEQKAGIIDESEQEVKEIERQYTSGLVTQGERYNKVVDIWGRAGDQIAKAMMDQLGNQKVIDRKGKEVNQESFNAIYMMADSGRARLRGADPPAGGHARPHGQARRLDHRDADHGQLPRRPERPAVLHLDPRRAQGPGGHGAQDRQLRLPHAPPGGRDAGSRGDRGGLRHADRHGDEGAGRGRRSGRGRCASASSAAS